MSVSVIDTLMSEHRRIEKMLFCLTKYVNDLTAQKSVDQSDLKKFSDFLRNYSDRMHHFKEEDLLFKAMIENGFPDDDGPIAVMLSDHKEGRGYVKVLASCTAGPDLNWSKNDIQKIAHAAHSFAGLLAQHIQKEDQILYPMALQILPGDAQMTLSENFDAFRSEHSADLQKFEKISNELFSRYGAGYELTQ